MIAAGRDFMELVHGVTEGRVKAYCLFLMRDAEIVIYGCGKLFAVFPSFTGAVSFTAVLRSA